MNRKLDSRFQKLATLEYGDGDTIKCLMYLSNLKYIDTLIKEQNLIVEQSFPFINAVSIIATPKSIKKLTKYSVVKFLTTPNKVFAQMEKSREIMQVNQFHANNILGTDVSVAVIDTGIEPMLDFCLPRYRIKNFVDLINFKQEPYDDNGHGTFVCGVLGGNGILSNKKYRGVAPDCDMVVIKALDNNGEGNSTKILEAMQWVYDNCERLNIRVVCMSFGSEPIERNDPLVKGAEMLWSVGIVVVVASGNSGPDMQTIKSPAVSSRVITVGGLDDGRDTDGNYRVADFSSRGPAGLIFKPDILAPSVNIISTNNKMLDGKGYRTMCGTSVATPMIAGVCALLLQKYPRLKPDRVKSYILNCGNAINYNRNEEGFGYFVAK